MRSAAAPGEGQGRKQRDPSQGRQQGDDRAQKRLFIALTCTDDERTALAQARRSVLAQTASGTPAADANLHLTLAFLGMRDADGERAAGDAVEKAARSCGPVDLALTALGTFKRRNRSIVWCGAAGGPALETLQRTLVRELAARGIELENRPFVPHITLARGVRAASDDELAQICAAASQPLPTRPVRHAAVSLMWSHRPEGGDLVYTPLLTCALRRE